MAIVVYRHLTTLLAHESIDSVPMISYIDAHIDSILFLVTTICITLYLLFFWSWQLLNLCAELREDVIHPRHSKVSHGESAWGNFLWAAL